MLRAWFLILFPGLANKVTLKRMKTRVNKHSQGNRRDQNASIAPSAERTLQAGGNQILARLLLIKPDSTFQKVFDSLPG